MRIEHLKVARGKALLVGVALFALSWLTVPTAIMLGTDYVHEGWPALPELSFLESAVVVVVSNVFRNRP